MLFAKRVIKMDDVKSIKKLREQLYADVWAEPMTAVAKKYNLSDNGVRKRCKSLNIPVPPFGYWPKKKAGKEVPECPALPPYNEIVLNNYIDNDVKVSSESQPIKQIEILKLAFTSMTEIRRINLGSLRGELIWTFSSGTVTKSILRKQNIGTRVLQLHWTRFQMKSWIYLAIQRVKTVSSAGDLF